MMIEVEIGRKVEVEYGNRFWVYVLVEYVFFKLNRGDLKMSIFGLNLADR